MSQVTRIKVRTYQDPTKPLYSVLIFEKEKETLQSLTHIIREKLGLNSIPGDPNRYKLLMFEDGGVIDDLSVIMKDDKIEILSIGQEQSLKGCAASTITTGTNY
jgi:hypothetical protein